MNVRRSCTPLFALAATLLLSGCSMLPRQKPAEEPPVVPEFTALPKGTSGGVFTAERPWALVADVRAFRPGDVLTVVLLETTQARKSADTSLGKSSSVDIPNFTIGHSSIDANTSISADREFSGSASSTQQNALQGALTVIVQEVLPNGLLRVHGEKSLLLNQGEEFLRVSGFVRAEDIDAENRISSQRVANARIAYSGRGSLADSNQAGWLTRFFSSPWMPF
ncbi:flagellar basal body L-ring protein FlgH [Steroidobacter sp.]|uniref:flagellar basal body L-ring protein FlgH n=1 Tax=Steroidobacter sp. TaxID=1978227 RepID=UPI001A58D559|nr:flagellar basal body L-ring protein FlgH [Steroidobacter sp.]MBL8265489.1 flagellar basal body L-ring protein FlgH [Steroidobacter sp.]